MEILIVLIRQMPVYIMAAMFFYKIFSHREKPKYSATKMVILMAIIFFATRIVNNIFNMYGIGYMIVAGGIVVVFNSFLYETKRKGLLLVKGVFLWIMEYGYEWMLAMVIAPWLWKEVDMNKNLPENDFLKLMYVAISFIGFTIYDVLSQKRKETVIKYIAILNFITGSTQIFLLKLCMEKNIIIGKEQISFATFIFSFVLVMEYFLTIEVFRESLEQREKENELAQMKLQQKYEYDYYQFAQKQGEEIRDIRHDLRNQLQTIQYMLKYGNKKEERIGIEMLEQLKSRLNY